MNKDSTRQVIAYACFIVASFVAIAALFIPPRGQISESALWTIAQFLITMCSLLEIQAAIETFTRKK